ncbi:MAG: hypothetical protein AAF085_10830, partial [Planctomycetota bacterium]
MPDETQPPTDDSKPDLAGTLDPPTTLGGILKKLGPGLIIAGTIVGSGELIATTAVGAEAGFVLMWLIIIGCLIKVFVQIEFGKYAIMNGMTTLDGMNEVPGPRFGGPKQGRVNWVCWFWLVFIVVALVQVGGIIGGVGQAVSIQLPLSEQGKVVDEYQSLDIQVEVIDGLVRRYEDDTEQTQRLEELVTERIVIQRQLDELVGLDPDDQSLLVEQLFYTRLYEIYSEDEELIGFANAAKSNLEAVDQEIERLVPETDELTSR